jgi:uncharacterized membrane protein (UPF0127 family)
MVGMTKTVGGAREFCRRSGERRARRRSPRWLFLTIVLFVLGTSLLGTALLGESAAGLEQIRIVSASGEHAFEVEVARTRAQQARGLMFRKWMPFDHGMLFVFEEEGPVRMWMKNTVLPLDMIFLSRTGRVVDIHEHAVPFSEDVITSSGVAKAVLEIHAGTAARIGLRRGDFIRRAVFAGSRGPVARARLSARPQ